MVTISCAALAAALALLPPPAAVARLGALRPGIDRTRPWRSPGAALPVVAGGVVGLVVAGPGGAVAGLLIGATVRRLRTARRTETAEAGTAGELASAITRMADELAAGAHPATALGGASADGPRARAVLAPAAAASGLGDDVPAALRRGAGEHPEVTSEIGRLAAAWALSDRCGVPLAELLAGAAADLGWRVRFAARVRAELAGPRATALVLTALPALGLALGQLVGADPIGVLRSGLLGQALLVVGVALAAAGVAWTEHILRAAVPR
ncbi:type II secretion system F family protein [Pseudonocardia abyssalis]|uniref:Secretion protein F n=1 Tax=Pseudonocardia abyssalis TaxID=2792008 RepID=A0ABS6UXA6_9PSEU|nr:type II secretion system protein [Pseudonocardia abyssalis]MBW0114941.1 secretion protein F [Pseudonocardia abyssalis]MBW0136924.1 secretion protein F [Pseudonocardia abyssalis]